MPKIITVTSLKGGVGKTTISLFLSQALQNKNNSVLLADLDPNNNATDYMLTELDTESMEAANIYHVLTRRKTLQSCIYAGIQSDCLPATLALHLANQELAANPMLILKLRQELLKTNYDFIILDTPPSIDALFRTGIYSADIVLTPLAPSRWIFQAIAFLKTELENIDRTPELLAVPSMVTPKEAESLTENLTGIIPITKTAIYKNASLKNSVEAKKTLKPESKTALQFDALAKELTK